MAHGGGPPAALLRMAACFVDVVFRSSLSDRGFAMFQRLIDGFKDSAGRSLGMSWVAAAAGMALRVTAGFVCGAGFVLVLQKYGPVQACLTGAAIFFVVTLIAAGSYMMRKRRIEARVEQAAKTAKSSAQTVLADPMLVAAGIQVIRAIGVKKLIPILAVGGLALGFLARRANTSSGEPPAG